MTSMVASIGSSSSQKAVLKSLFLVKMKIGKMKNAVRNQHLASRNLMEKTFSSEKITGTMSQINCSKMTITIGLRHHHSGRILRLCTSNKIKSNRNIHISGSSGTEVESDFPNKKNWMETGRVNKKNQ